jgi:hypothetical protein
MRDDRALTDIVNQSGFPLQMAVEHLVRARAKEQPWNQQAWQVLYREHGWQSPEGHSGFIDLVLQRGDWGPYVLVLECKRNQEAEWLFLVDEGAEKPTKRVRVWITNTREGQRRFSSYFDVLAEPPSPVSMFCVMNGHDPKSRPMLERVSAELCTAKEALAEEEINLPAAKANGGVLRMYASVIVTNARLVLSRIDPGSIDLASGKTPAAQHTDHPWIRFRKHFSGKPAVRAEAPTFGAAALAKEKSVFVVNASHLSRFLDEWSISDHTLGPLMQPAPPRPYIEPDSDSGTW